MSYPVRMLQQQAYRRKRTPPPLLLIVFRVLCLGSSCLCARRPRARGGGGWPSLLVEREVAGVGCAPNARTACKTNRTGCSCVQFSPMGPQGCCMVYLLLYITGVLLARFLSTPHTNTHPPSHTPFSTHTIYTAAALLSVKPPGVYTQSKVRSIGAKF